MKISELVLLGAADIDKVNDLLAIVDASSSVTKRTTLTDVYTVIVAPDVATLNGDIATINGQITSINNQLTTINSELTGVATKTDLDNAQAAIEANDNTNTTTITTAVTNAITKVIGAGRELSLRFPFDASGFAGTSGGSRGSTTGAAVGAWTVMASGAAVSSARYDGTQATKSLPGVGQTSSGLVWKWTVGVGLYETPVPAAISPVAAWSHRATIAISANLVNAGAEIGVSLQIPGATNGVITAASAGVFFGLDSTNAVKFIARTANGGALTINDVVTPAGFDPTVYHNYELRFGAALNGQAAWIQGYLDGVAVTTRYTWASGLLPNSISYFTALVPLMSSDNPNAVYCSGMELIAARTEDALGA